eukprot:c18246_g1_i1 orf=122-649(+)
MQARVSATRRPSGTDGSDFTFRMTVEDRYKIIAQKKSQLQKALVVQALSEIVKAISTIFTTGAEDVAFKTALASCIFGAVAVLPGTLGLKRSSPHYLRLFVFATALAILLSAVPLLLGFYYSKDTNNWEMFRVDGNNNSIGIGLMAAQEIIGLGVKLVGVTVTHSLLQQLTRRRS